MPGDPNRDARVAVARRRVGRAAGLLRDARRDLSALSDGADTIAVVHVTDDPSTQEVLGLLRVARAARPGGVDVVILARPDTG
jgi:hypothetical protein